MIWLTWRQHRGELLLIGGILTALAAILIVTGAQIATTYQQLGVAACVAHPAANSNCGQIIGGFDDQFGWMRSAVGWLNLLPALIGILVGAPLVARELEHSTQRLVWTQSVTRARWLMVKLLGVFVMCLLASAILTALLAWWRAPFATLQGSFSPDGFDLVGIVPLAYMAFALALGIAAGTLLRRAIPAMVVTLGGFLAVRLPILTWVRPYYLPPLTVNWDPTQLRISPVSRADWQFSQNFVDAHGHTLSDPQAYSACAGVQTKGDFFQCLHTHHWLIALVYQPANRFWLFQGIETAIFVALTLALISLTIWWVRWRIS
ncbi:MAG: ABC transporter permease subunit [Ktedonobacterales bacterium]